MQTIDASKLYTSAKQLVEDRVASRLHAKDASLYDFSEEACSCARNFMGWADLATNPPCPIDRIQAFADAERARGLKTVVLIGQGGSTQAPMTITKYNKPDSSDVAFKTLDSDSPVRIREILSELDPATSLFIVSSKSGGTIEPRLALRAVRAQLANRISDADLVKRLVAITDPGSKLEQLAHDEGWLAVFSGEPTVGGRFSALSVFGLLPAALVGIDLQRFMEYARAAETRCSADVADNPAIALAAFLYEGYEAGRNKFSFVTPPRGRVLGLWIEQLVAESVGKEGKGILPSIEVDSLLLASDSGDRGVVTYETKADLPDETRDFRRSLECLSPDIPRMDYQIDAVEQLAEHFIMWEYAVAMCGYLMRVCPFDQPDVASAKAVVLDILRDGQPDPDFTQSFYGNVPLGQIEVRMAPRFAGQADVRGALKALFDSIKPGDFFAINAFLPFTGEGRREALEVIRHGVARAKGVASCLEVGPRYLHSTGQLQKGGPNCGVFLILSADEPDDIPLSQEADSLGALAKAQALGDMATLSARGRRVVHLHLPDNAGVTLRLLASIVEDVLQER
ncbi:glucose-6-phosphate isomerase [Adlercreutzia sp. ZJ141]|uniref:glucose-6-phosphate isomerase n=1 Tax=Adlercreutzia sp. ZJ141 TaxID=2709406 RepID=UPI0013EBC139|nr:glucose-6-phosphate isomerase [Adlercreutzia sp. ZJ141]